MSNFEDERLRILERVSAGELTPQQGQLEIAMLKVGGPDPADGHVVMAADAAEEQARAAGDAWREAFEQARPPSPWALGALVLAPFVAMGLVMAVGLAFFLALPAYLVMLGWNGLVVPAVPGLATIGFFQTLAIMVIVSLVSSVVRWRRRVQVFVSGQGGFREQ